MSLKILNPENMLMKSDMFYIEQFMKNTEYMEILNLQVLNCRFKACFPYNKNLINALLLLGYVINTRSKKNDLINDIQIDANINNIDDLYIIADWFNIYNILDERLLKYKILHIHSHNIHAKTVINIVDDIIKQIYIKADSGEYSYDYYNDNEKILEFIQKKFTSIKYKITTGNNFITISWGSFII